MKKVKKEVSLNFLNVPCESLFRKLMKDNYTIVSGDNPAYVFFTLKPSVKQKGNIRNISSKLPFLKKYASKIYQSLCELPILDSFFYKIFYDKLKMPILRTKAKCIFYTAENCRPDMKNCEWAFTFDYDEEVKSPHHLRLPYYKLEGAGIDLIKKKVNVEKIKKEKTRFCAFIYSKNVPFRNKFFKKLSKYKRVDAPGNSMRNMDPIGSQKQAKDRFIPNASRGDWQKEKLDFLRQYKFSVAFENSSYPGYTTEKIYHPMLANSIPIYWGNRLVHKDFNTKSFINYYDFEKKEMEKIPTLFLKIPFLKKLIQILIIRPRTINSMIKRIIEIDNNDELYEQYLKESWYPENKPTKYVNDQEIKKRIKEIFG